METATEKILTAYEIERNKPMPTFIHGVLQANLIIRLAKYIEKYRIASEVSLNTLPDFSTPDLVLYPMGELDFRNDPARRNDAPLLIVEIQSPSQSTRDMVEKLEQYFNFGVKSCWIVIPDIQAILVYESVDTYHFFHNDELLIDLALKIEFQLSEIFK